MLRPVSFYSGVNILTIPLFLCSLKHRKKRKAKKQPPPIRKSMVNLLQQRAEVTNFKKNFVVFHMQAEVLHLCSADKTCPQAAGALRFALGEHSTLKWSGFTLIWRISNARKSIHDTEMKPLFLFSSENSELDMWGELVSGCSHFRALHL